MQRMQTLDRTIFWLMLCALLALLVPLETNAQPQDGSELAIAGSMLHFGYEEFDENGSLLDRDEGYIQGFTLGLNQTFDRWVFAADFSYHGGGAIYTGKTQTGIPASTRTMEYITDFALRTEYWAESDYAFYAGAGQHHWDRDILAGKDANGMPVSGMRECYSWWTSFIGAKAVMYETSSVSWIADASLRHIHNPTVNVTYGQYDNLSMALGKQLGLRLSLPWRFSFNRHTRFNMEPYAENFEFGRSENTPLTQNGNPVIDPVTGRQRYIYEPRSQTTKYGFTFGISQHF